MRPANIVTAWADILVGFAAAGGLNLLLTNELSPLNMSEIGALGGLLLATSGLYGGGVVFNDVFDLELDQTERPERPLPSGRASLTGAVVLGSSLLALGILSATKVGWISGICAAIVAITALIYDSLGKHLSWLGPLNMGLCRGGNMLLGVSVMPAMLAERWFIAILPILYIAAITTISQGEVKGGKRQTGLLAIALILLVMLGVLGLGGLAAFHWGLALPFLGLFGVLVLPAFITATQDPSPLTIQQAVKAGVLSLIVLDAAIAAGYTTWLYGLGVLLLLPVSMSLARIFSVT